MDIWEDCLAAHKLLQMDTPFILGIHKNRFVHRCSSNRQVAHVVQGFAVLKHSQFGQRKEKKIKRESWHSDMGVINHSAILEGCLPAEWCLDSVPWADSERLWHFNPGLLGLLETGTIVECWEWWIG